MDFGPRFASDAAHEERRLRFFAALGIDRASIGLAVQVHGADVVVDPPPSDKSALRADALVACHGAAVAVKTADCCPILLASESANGVAAVHAGWRGACAGVVLEAARELGTIGTITHAAIGPTIGACCFEIGEEVAQALERAAPPGTRVVVREGYPKPHGDLRALVRAQIRAVGLSDAQIENVGGCTMCDAQAYHSYRRDGAESGRMLSVIARRQL